MHSDPVTAAQAERLARLAARNRGVPATSPLTTRTQPVPDPAAATPTLRPTPRRHVAKASRRAALVMSLTTTAGLSAWFSHVATQPATAGTPVADGAVPADRAVTAAAPDATPTTTATQLLTPAASAAALPTTPTAAVRPASTATVVSSVPAPPAATAVPATYTGNPVTIRYGTVQVAVTVTDGKLTGVATLSAPTGRNMRFTNAAIPVLTREALAAQAASIDAVSGATYTSRGYIGSLQSAIDAARAAGALA